MRHANQSTSIYVHVLKFNCKFIVCSWNAFFCQKNETFLTSRSAPFWVHNRAEIFRSQKKKSRKQIFATLVDVIKRRNNTKWQQFYCVLILNADKKEKGWYGGGKDPLFLKKATGKCYWRPGELMRGWQERRRHGEISMKQIYVFCSKIIPGASLLVALVSICECWSHTKYFVSWNTSLSVCRLCMRLDASPISESAGG